MGWGWKPTKLQHDAKMYATIYKWGCVAPVRRGALRAVHMLNKKEQRCQKVTREMVCRATELIKVQCHRWRQEALTYANKTNIRQALGAKLSQGTQLTNVCMMDICSWISISLWTLPLNRTPSRSNTEHRQYAHVGAMLSFALLALFLPVWTKEG